MPSTPTSTIPYALVVDDDVEVLEGTWHGTRTVIVEFESVARAKEWYASDSYRSALPLRLASAECSVVLASGFNMSRAGS